MATHFPDLAQLSFVIASDRRKADDGHPLIPQLPIIRLRGTRRFFLGSSLPIGQTVQTTGGLYKQRNKLQTVSWNSRDENLSCRLGL